MRATSALLLIPLLLAHPAAAASSAIVLDYQAYAHGLPVMRMFISVETGPHTYQLRINYRTTGITRFLFPGDQWDSVTGTWDEAGPKPSEYKADGIWGGKNRQALIDYPGGVPETRIMQPPLEQEREPVPAEQQVGTVDPLSGIMRLIQQVKATGRCDLSRRTFDGRRLVTLSVKTGPTVDLSKTGRSGFFGPALECDFTGQMTGGFLKNRASAPPPPPMQGSAWMAQITPGGLPVPVRMRFQTRWLGDVTMYLTSAGTDPGTDPAPKAP